MKNNKKKRIRIAGIFCFLLYILLLVYLLFFAEWYGREPSKTRNYQYNLVLFQEIRRYWNYRTQLGFQAVFLNLFGNILGFIPFGFLLPALSTRLRNPWTVIFMGFSFSFLIECTQLIGKVGCFDVDDMLLNTLGVIIGCWIYTIMRSKKNGKKI